MIGVAYGAVLEGIGASIVRVEADVAPGLPNFSIVGLPDSAVQESKLRVRSAMKNSGFGFPNCRLTVNLSPASVRKRGPGLDLAIAMSILHAQEQVSSVAMSNIAFCGELGLSGQLAAVSGIVPLALAFKNKGFSCAIVSDSQTTSLAPIPGFAFGSCHDLAEVVRICAEPVRNIPPSILYVPLNPVDETDAPDMEEVYSLTAVKRALCIAAIGRHHTMLIGPPGCGKTMVAERFGTILPPLTDDEALEVFAIHQAAGSPRKLVAEPPLRMPHHSVTRAAMVGGGHTPVPGEVTLAHRGVLVLDELLEFSRTTLDSLREPLTSGTIQLSRGQSRCIFPAGFTLLATLNPCLCGHRGTSRCTCTDSEVKKYWSVLSGPLLDRMDLTVTITPQMSRSREQVRSVTSGELRSKVRMAREELQSFDGLTRPNFRDMTASGRSVLSQITNELHFSTRAIASIVRVARSIRTLDGCTTIQAEHLQEAMSLRGGSFV